MTFGIDGNAGLIVRVSPQDNRVADQNAVSQNATEVTASHAPIASESVTTTNVVFAPDRPVSSSPLDQIGTDIAGALRSFAERRESFHSSVGGAGGPATALDEAKQELLSGPASIAPAASQTMLTDPARDMNFSQAMEAMARTFDYAVETQLIVQSSSKVSSSASALLRAQ